MMKQKYKKIQFLVILMLGMLINGMTTNAASVEDLKNKFPNGAYWNHVVKSGHGYSNYADYGSCNNPDGYTWSPCDTHIANAGIGGHDCNSFQNAMQCCGFVKKLAYDLYGSTHSSWGKTNLSNAKCGDVIHYTGAGANPEHWAMIIGRNGSVLTFGECNVGSNCKISWGRTLDTNTMSWYEIYSAPWQASLTSHKHSYTGTVTKQPTCTATGVKTYKCSCGSSYTESIAAKGHSYKNTIVAPTTTEKGYTLHTCSVCGNSYKDTYVNPPSLNSDGYYHCTILPSGVTADKYTIQYNNYYEKIQANSPGSGWTNAGKTKDVWENSGSQYTSESNLTTSESRVLVRSYYYHFCGPNAGNVGNYEQTGNYVHYDEVDAAYVNVSSSGMDGSHPWYVIAWKSGGTVWCQSGSTCNGSYGTHGARCKAWYKHNVYQNKTHVVQYKFTKYSGWTTAKDSTAKSTEIRYKLKETTPVVTLSSISVKKITTSYYVGDSVNIDDITVTVTYSDKKTQNIAVSRCVINSNAIDMSTEGEKTLTVQYTENSKTVKSDITINVLAKAIETDDSNPELPTYNDETLEDMKDSDNTNNEESNLKEVQEDDLQEVINIENSSNEATNQEAPKKDVNKDNKTITEENQEGDAFENDDENWDEVIINPKRVANIKVKAKGSGKINITWKNDVNADYYKVQIATKKNFKKDKRVRNVYTNKLTWRGLKKGKTYYVRIKAYNFEGGISEKWSNIKKVKMK